MGFQTSRRGVLAGAVAMVCIRGARSVESVSDGAPAAGQLQGAADGERSGRSAPAAGVSGEAHSRSPDAISHLIALEKREGGRLGVVAIDTASGRRLDHRGSERFAMCSTFKFLAAAAVLQRVDRGMERLDRMIEYGDSDLLENAPVSKEHVREGRLTLLDLCSAAVQWSDNTAANLLLKVLGGPEGFTAFIRTLGDNVTRVDHDEPSLNVVRPGEMHDTTTPAAMVALLSAVLLGKVLTPDSRSRLEGWMLDTKVGQHRIPAGLPPGWRIAHRPGTWDSQTNDVGVLWPVNRAPIVIAAYYQRGDRTLDQRETILRDVGRIVSTAF